MALPSSGAITLGQVNTELGRSATQELLMNDNAVRTLAQVGGTNTVISMQNLRGKSAGVTLAFSSGLSPYVFAGDEYSVVAQIQLHSNGTMVYYSNNDGQSNQGPATYFTPTTNAGGNFEFRLNVSSLPQLGNLYNGAYVTILNVGTGGTLHTISTTGFTPYFGLGVTTTAIQMTAVYYDHNPGARNFNGTLEIRHTSGSPSISRTFDMEVELY